MFLYIFCIISVIYFLYNFIKDIYKVLKCFSIIGKAKKNNELVIQCENIYYSKVTYISSILFCLFVLLFSLDYCSIPELIKVYKIKPILGLYITLAYLLIIVLCVSMILKLHFDKYAFLTSVGICCFDKVFRFDEYRFTWEERVKEDQMSDTLHIYKQIEKSRIKRSFMFNEDKDNARRLVYDNIGKNREDE